MRMKLVYQPQGRRIHIEELCEIESIPVKQNIKKVNDFWEKFGSLMDEK